MLGVFVEECDVKGGALKVVKGFGGLDQTELVCLSVLTTFGSLSAVTTPNQEEHFHKNWQRLPWMAKHSKINVDLMPKEKMLNMQDL